MMTFYSCNDLSDIHISQKSHNIKCLKYKWIKCNLSFFNKMFLLAVIVNKNCNQTVLLLIIFPITSCPFNYLSDLHNTSSVCNSALVRSLLF